MGDLVDDSCKIEKLEEELFETKGDFKSAAALLNAERKKNKELETLLNTPELKDFIKAVPLEAAHQRERWGVEHDAGKEPEDWFWLLGYLAGKALAAVKVGDKEKALHHTISSAAALANWHAAINSKEKEDG